VYFVPLKSEKDIFYQLLKLHYTQKNDVVSKSNRRLLLTFHEHKYI
jgi:hypothetical protein